MKYTDRFFSFPIRIYDGKTLDENNEGEGDWIVGVVRIPFDDMRYSCWYDGFSRDKNVEEVNKEGFDTTIVSNKMHGQFNCIWNRKKFEEKLNEGIAKYEQLKEAEKKEEKLHPLQRNYVSDGNGLGYWGSATDPK